MTVDLIFGNSHTAAYISGHQRLAAEGRVDHDLHRANFNDSRYHPDIEFIPGGARANPTIIAELRSRIAALSPTCLVTAAMGSFHWIEGMALHEQPFDFWAPGLPGHPPDPALELIPYDMMARHCRGGIGWQLAIVKDILSFTTLPIFHIEAPPPVANADLMLQGAASHPTTREGLQKTGAASPLFRLKVWWAWTASTREACGELGLHFVEAPPETRDAQGFLDERYFLDGVHGNVDYGALLVREVAKAKRRLGLG